MKQQFYGGTALAKAVEKVYEAGETDYSLCPLALEDETGKPEGLIEKNDAVVFCCRRGEREIELTDAFTAPDFSGFPREKIDPLTFVILTMYHEKYTYLPIAFAPSRVTDTLAETVSRAGKTQLHCAESEKFAHVTFFLNGGNQQPFPGEDDVRVPSPKGVPFDSVPALSLPEVAEKVCAGLDHGYDFIVTNFANGDVIGHTANEEAKVACAHIVDEQLGNVLAHARQTGYTVFITADHGNLECMRTPEGKPHVSHTMALVPFITASPDGAMALTGDRPAGKLCDIAPTVLAAMGVEQPAAMTGKPLVKLPGGEARKVLLIILDGWGDGAADETNPVHLAETKIWDALLAAYPTVYLRASGDAVGLAEGKAGNSEAGHLNIGAGRVVLQDDVRLDEAMRDGSFAQNPVFLSAIETAKARGGALHLIALLTKKSSHGSIDYPLALLRMAKAQGMERVFVHVIFDGRSTEPGSAPALLVHLESEMAEIGVGVIVSGVGRGIALDRDQNWVKVEKAYRLLTEGAGTRYRA